MGCLDCLSKYLLFVLNSLVFLIGVAVTAIGILGLVGIDTLFESLDDIDLGVEDFGDEIKKILEDILKEVQDVSGTSLYVILAIGIFILVLGFLGCCGACKKSSCMLKTYASIILVLVVVQITFGVLAVVWSGSVEEQIKTDLWKTFDKYDPMDNKTRVEIDVMHQTLKCCGVVSYEDWKNSTHLSPISSVPDSCCEDPKALCGYEYFIKNPNTEIYKQGCYQMAKEDIIFYIDLVGGIYIGIVAVQVLCVVGAFYLSCKSKK